MCGTLTLNPSKCHGFKIRISIIHKSVNTPKLKLTDKPHPSNFLKMKGRTLSTIRTFRTTSCLPIATTKTLTLTLTTTKTNNFLLQTEENQWRSSANPSDQGSTLLKTTSTKAKVVITASSKTQTTMFLTLFHTLIPYKLINNAFPKLRNKNMKVVR